MSKAIIVGAGEVGKSLYDVLKDSHEMYLRDTEDLDIGSVDFLNICFPYSYEFEKSVKEYQEKYHPSVTIIHSTVPVGTSRRLGAVHSPIHGKHPDLSGGIKTFVKYLGGAFDEEVDMAEKFLQQAGIKTHKVRDPETSELSKLWCTTQYGWNIVLMKEIYKSCQDNGADFDSVYKLWNQLYNWGYEDLDMPQFKRYVLDYKDGKIGGHCVINNCKLLKNDITKFILEKDGTY